MRTRALKVTSNFSDKEQVYKELMECLAKGDKDPKLSLMSNTNNFKSIPFINKIFTKDQTTRLIKKQNHFLHNTHGISVVNLNLIDGVFEEKHRLVNKKHHESRKRKVESFFENHERKVNESEMDKDNSDDEKMHDKISEENQEEPIENGENSKGEDVDNEDEDFEEVDGEDKKEEEENGEKK